MREKTQNKINMIKRCVIDNTSILDVVFLGNEKKLKSFIRNYKKHFTKEEIEYLENKKNGDDTMSVKIEKEVAELKKQFEELKNQFENFKNKTIENQSEIDPKYYNKNNITKSIRVDDDIYKKFVNVCKEKNVPIAVAINFCFDQFN